MIPVIKDVSAWEKWEAEAVLSQPPDFERNLRLLQAMYQEAASLGRLAWSQPLEGLESRIRLARALNVRNTSGTNRF